MRTYIWCLPSPIKKLALLRQKEAGFIEDENKPLQTLNFEGVFNWHNTPEGFEFWSDIDIVGTKGREFVIVECKEWISSSKQDAIEEIEEKFRNAADFFDGIGLTKGKNVRFIFARIESEPKFEKLLNSLSIKLGKSVECVDFRQLVKEMIEEICPFIDSTHIGKFGEPISWLLSRLIYYELIKTEATTT